MASAKTTTYQTDDGPMPAVIAPADDFAERAIVMIHENRGLTSYMRDVQQQLGAQGYRVVAPDLMHRIESNDIESSTRSLPMERHVTDIRRCLDWVEGMHHVTAVALVGFCFGAEAAMLASLDRSELRCVVAWYGIPPDPADAPRMRSPLLLMLAEEDDRVNRHVGPFLESLERTDRDFVAESYPGTRHAFHDWTRPERFNPAAATVAWQRCIDFLGNHLQ